MHRHAMHRHDSTQLVSPSTKHRQAFLAVLAAIAVVASAQTAWGQARTPKTNFKPSRDMLDVANTPGKARRTENGSCDGITELSIAHFFASKGAPVRSLADEGREIKRVFVSDLERHETKSLGRPLTAAERRAALPDWEKKARIYLERVTNQAQAISQSSGNHYYVQDGRYIAKGVSEQLTKTNMPQRIQLVQRKNGITRLHTMIAYDVTNDGGDIELSVGDPDFPQRDDLRLVYETATGKWVYHGGGANPIVFNRGDVMRRKGDERATANSSPFPVKPFQQLLRAAKQSNPNAIDPEARIRSVQATFQKPQRSRSKFSEPPSPLSPGRLVVAADPKVGGVLIRFDPAIWEDMSDDDRRKISAAMDSVLRGESRGLVYRAGPASETFVRVSLRELLESNSPTLGNLTRVRGYILRDDDIVLLGRAEPGKPAVSLDFLTVAMNVMDASGRGPYISLDPDPWNYAAPHRLRIGNVDEAWRKSDFIAAMVEADYLMKQISLGEVESGVPGFESYVDLAARYPRTAGSHPTRSWLTPAPSQPGDIQTARGVTLFDTDVIVLSERMKRAGDALASSTADNSLGDREAASFSLHYRDIEQIHTSFYRLHQVLDVCHLATIWKMQKIDREVLTALSERDVKEVEIPDQFAGIGPKQVALVDKAPLLVAGGSVIRVRISPNAIVESESVGRLLTENTLSRQPVRELTANVFPELLITQAGEDFLRGEMKSCVERTTMALEQEPELWHGYAQRGMALYQMGRVEEALQDFDRAVQGSQELLVARAGIRLYAGDADGAMEDAERAVELFPDEPIAWHTLATVRLHALDWAGAARALEEVFARSPFDEHAIGVVNQLKMYRRMDAAAAERRLRELRSVPLPLTAALQSISGSAHPDQASESLADALELADGLEASNSLYLRERILMGLATSVAAAQPSTHVWEGMWALEFSPDSKRLAFRAIDRDRRPYLVVDNTVYDLTPDDTLEHVNDDDDDRTDLREQRGERLLRSGDLDRIVFSPDSRHVAHVLSDAGGDRVFIDGDEIAFLQGVVAAPVFNDKSAILEVVAWQGELLARHYLRVPSTSLDVSEATPPVQVVARAPASVWARGCLVGHGGRTLVLPHESAEDADDVEPAEGVDVIIAAEEDFACPPTFSPDRKRLALVRPADEPETWEVVIDGEVSSTYERISGDSEWIKFSADSRSYAYVARRADGEWLVCHNGKELPLPGRAFSVSISPDGKRVGLLLHGEEESDEDSYVWVNGKRNEAVKKQSGFAQLFGGKKKIYRPYGDPVFAANGVIGYVAFDVESGKNVIIDGKPQGALGEIESLAVSPDGKRWACLLRESGDFDPATNELSVSYYAVVDRRMLRLHPAYRYVDQLRSRQPDWSSATLLEAIVTSALKPPPPIRIDVLMKEAFAKKTPDDALLAEYELRYGERFKDYLYLSAARSAMNRDRSPAPFLKELRDSPGVAGVTARTLPLILRYEDPQQRESVSLRLLQKTLETPCGDDPSSVLARRLIYGVAVAMNRGDLDAIAATRALHSNLPAESDDGEVADEVAGLRASMITAVSSLYEKHAKRDKRFVALAIAASEGELDGPAIVKRAAEIGSMARADSKKHDSPMIQLLVEMELEILPAKLEMLALNDAARRVQYANRFLLSESGAAKLSDIQQAQQATIDRANASLRGRIARNRQRFLNAVDLAETRGDLSMLLDYLSPQRFVERMDAPPAPEQVVAITNAVAELNSKIRHVRLRRDRQSQVEATAP
ncbi:MAG: hypothetical protein QGG36_17060 [Pirellulaceae bacterium]|nr:hypothetical protein [Pirellulaceae bacterium]